MLARSFGVVALTFLPAARIIHSHWLPQASYARQATQQAFNRLAAVRRNSVAPAP
jgi:hypothetical protein